MKNLMFLLAFVMTFSFFTSCKNDQLESLEETTTLNTQKEAPTQEEESEALQSGTETELFKKITQIDENAELLIQDFDPTKAGGDDVGLRNITKTRSLSSSSSYEDLKANCGEWYNGSTRHQPNRYDNHFYQYFGFNHPNLNGGDRAYYLELNHKSIVTLNLSHANSNMAMLLFKGDFNKICNSNDPNDCYVEEIFEHVVHYSTSSSYEYEHLGPMQLMPGKYILIVDNKYNYNSDFRLEMICRPVGGACYDTWGTGLFADDFEYYELGDLCRQSYFWEKWNPHADYDARVKRNSHGNQYVKIERQHNYANHDEPDVLLKLGERNWGHFQIHFDMWVFEHKTAYFNIQKNLTYQNEHNEFGGQVFFYSNGTGAVKIAGNSYSFYYPRGEWMDIKLDVNLDDDRTRLYINGDLKASWSCRANSHGHNGYKRIEALDFYPPYANSQFFIDNVCFTDVH